MRKIFLALLLVCGAVLLNAQQITKLKNRSPQRLTMTQENGVFTMSLKPDDGNDSEASTFIKNPVFYN